MKVALGSDERTELTDAIVASLKNRGHEVLLLGALGRSGAANWPQVGHAVARSVTDGGVDYGIVCCWSGTGVSIAANKIPGARAALCSDARTATAAREWNDANVLALGLSGTSPAAAEQILDAWFSTAPTADSAYAAMIDAVEPNPNALSPVSDA
ncbi:MAG: galactose isomerase [Candidatus Meridianibacter frigidus]|nr:MAG: galactose isomerase [Candidatus Eremiobacteraeota bacterium]